MVIIDHHQEDDGNGDKKKRYRGHPWPPSSAGIMAVSMNFEVAGTDSTLNIQRLCLMSIMVN